MLNLKKVIASICVLAMVLSTVAFGATYTDVAEDSAYYEAVETLNKLDIIEGYEDGTFKPEDGVTRAEMAALIARIQGYGDTAAGSANTGFTDVPSSHWASGYIANAAGMGIINGYGDGTFGPEDPVLYEQAVKMVMATLGYTPFAEKNGGYPTGYLAAAQRYSVSLAVANAVVGQEANRGTVAQLLVNALDTPLMIQNAWNTNGEVEYIIADGTGDRTYRTLMSENLGYVKIRGIVEENTVTDLTQAKNIDTSKEATVYVNVKDAFKTTDKKFYDVAGNLLSTADDYYLVGSTDVEDYIGQSVIGYVKKLSTDKYEFVSVAVDTNRNDELVINLADYAGYDSTNFELDYYRDGANDTTAAKLATYNSALDVNVIINGEGGKTVANMNAAIGSLPSAYGGEITLIDNDDVRGYDVIVLDLAATAVVKKTTSNSIALYNNAKIGGASQSATKTIYVYPEDETKVVKIYKDGEEIDFTELNEWDVLSVYAASSTADVITAEVIADEVVGTIASEKTSKTSASTKAYKVGDNWYDVAAGAYTENPEVGVGGKFYIDGFGKIAAFIEDSALAGGVAGNYGYVMAVAAEEKSFGTTGIDAKAQMLTEDGVEVLTIKNNASWYKTSGSAALKLDVNAWTWTDAGAMNNKIEASELSGGNSAEFANIAALKGQIVKFTKDSNGYISSIIPAGYTKAGAGEAEVAAAAGHASAEYDADSNRLSNVGYIDAEALVFVVDVDGSGNVVDEAKFKVATAADFTDKNVYDIKNVYTTKGSEDADIVVVSSTTFDKAGVTANVAVITGISTGSDDEGNTVYTLTFLQDMEEQTLDTTEDVYTAISSWITIGDVVKVKTTGDVISDVTDVFNFADGVRNAGTIAGSNGLIGDIDTSAYTGAAFITGTAGTSEAFIGGKVVNWKDSSEVATFTGGAEAKIGRAVNYYTIDNTGYELRISADGSFANLSDAIYDGTGSNNICDEDGNTVTGLGSVTDAVAQTYADYVYVRMYENKPVDVIVVKGAKNIIVK